MTTTVRTHPATTAHRASMEFQAPPAPVQVDLDTLRTEIPEEMQVNRRWLVWKSIPQPLPKKPRKVPYYCDGTERRGTLDSPEDQSRLGVFEDALIALESGRYAGLGFALGPDGTGKHWQGIDLDRTDIRPELAALVEQLPGYVERSPSGTGVHAIGYGPGFQAMASNASGIEAYAAGRFFTVTAEAIGGDIEDIAGFVSGTLAPLHRVTATGPGRHDTPVESVTPGQVAELRSALLHLRADDRELWVRMGHALKGLGGTGRGLWLDWSATSEKFDAADASRTWESFRPEHTGHAAVFAEAQRHGWVNPMARTTAQEPPPYDGAPHPADASDEPIKWTDPHPLTTKIDPEPYPLDALPDAIRKAVEEVAGFVKAPLPLVAGSALAALSLASQAHIDVKRAEKLQGPTGLFLLTIADSGERKSTCDGFFTSAIRQFQDEQEEALKPAIKKHEAAMSAWSAEREGILSAIREAGKKQKATDQLRTNLAELQQEQPEPPRVPRMMLGDETPESLAWSLAKQWPSAGVLSSEAGVVLGSHGMGKDSLMRNLAFQNVLWDGGTHSVGRRTSETFTVSGERLTIALQVQEATLRGFFEKSGTLARGTGFLARFLVAWPESTQGYRPFTEAPVHWPHLAAFHRRIAAIVNHPTPIDDNGSLTPILMSLSPDAKRAWIAYHDAIESELVNGGELYDVRDVASKTADNAVRLAALFQLYQGGMADAIGLDSFESASRIAAWHLHESRRFFGELALPDELADAARLDGWLVEYCRRERTLQVPTRDAQRLGPVRDGKRLDVALRELADLDRVRVTTEGKRRIIKVNPALLGDVP